MRQLKQRKGHVDQASTLPRQPSAPLAYVQRLRIEDAKRRPDRTGSHVDEIS